jgi:deoxyribodipyrimidine photo-lyase
MIPMTREAGLARLAAFLPHAAAYAAARNHDHGPERRENVSMLSFYLRHRLVLEEEVAAAVLGRFAYPAVEKFLQELAWRTYWKGWLEMRPQVWSAYLREQAATPVTAECRAAMEGRTGIGCFDAWSRELVDTGYLHNHARMWFASIWIFTLRLPWQAGADFLHQNLLDGDPASNTLSWRWVAGLHTKGKHYLAKAENIARYTDGRFDPKGRLNETAAPLPSDGDFVREPLRLPEWETPAGRIGHLLLADDLGPPPCVAHATAGWHPARPESLCPAVSPGVHEARSAAVDDAVARAEGERLTGDLTSSVQDWMDRCRLDSLMVAYPTVGPWKPLVDELARRVPLRIFVRAWDRALWPHAGAGFFRLRSVLEGFYGEHVTPGNSGHRE